MNMTRKAFLLASAAFLLVARTPVDPVNKNGKGIALADGSQIHANYNGWVQRLDNTIRARLTGL